MKKILVSVLLLASCSFAAQYDMQAGGFETLVGWNKYTPAGHFDYSVGVNWGLGVTFKKYFKYIRYNDWNPYWHAGTVALLVPYAGVGIDYVARDWYAGIGTFWVAPELHVGMMF